MPTIRIGKYKLRFYSSDFREPPHVHVLHENKVAKIWLQSVVAESNHGYNATELNRILRLVRQNQEMLLEAWNVYFSR